MRPRFAPISLLPSFESLTSPPVSAKSSGFSSIFAIIWIFVVYPPLLFPIWRGSPSDRMLQAVRCAFEKVESIMAMLRFPHLIAKAEKISLKIPALLQRLNFLRIESKLPYFSGISLQKLSVRITQRQQLIKTRLSKNLFPRGAGKYFLSLLNCLLEIMGIFISHILSLGVRWQDENTHFYLSVKI